MIKVNSNEELFNAWKALDGEQLPSLSRLSFQSGIVQNDTRLTDEDVSEWVRDNEVYVKDLKAEMEALLHHIEELQRKTLAYIKK